MHETKMYWRMEPQQAENKTRLYLYDDISEYGQWNWDTWEYDESETSAKYFADKLAEIPEGQTIELHINSNGGSVKEGVGIYNLLRQKENQKTGIVDGVAHSVAFLILQACDRRVMCLGTTALIHNMWMCCCGNANQLRKYADDLDAMMESNRKVFMERATISEDDLEAMMDRETYLTPDKALEYGLIDEIMEIRGKEPKPEDLEQKLRELQQMLNSQQSFRDQIKLMQAGKKKKPSMMELFKGLTDRKGGNE